LANRVSTPPSKLMNLVEQLGQVVGAEMEGAGGLLQTHPVLIERLDAVAELVFG
jgi:hypothetical protein